METDKKMKDDHHAQRARIHYQSEPFCEEFKEKADHAIKDLRGAEKEIRKLISSLLVSPEKTDQCTKALQKRLGIISKQRSSAAGTPVSRKTWGLKIQNVFELVTPNKQRWFAIMMSR